jgi:hypothetical protein
MAVVLGVANGVSVVNRGVAKNASTDWGSTFSDRYHETCWIRMELFAHREKIETILFGVIHEQDEFANAYSFQSTPARGTVVTYSFTRINLD